MQIDGVTKSSLSRLASYLQSRSGKVEKALAARLSGVVETGSVEKGQFTIADLNTLQGHVNSSEFMAEVLQEIAKGEQTVATEGAADEAARSKDEAKLLREFQAAVEVIII